MRDMKDLERTISREESQNNENDDMELDNKHTYRIDTNAKVLNSRNCTEETRVNIDLLTNKENSKECKTSLWSKILRICYKGANFLKPVILFMVLYLFFKEVRRETTDSPILTDTPQHTDPPPKVLAQQSELKGFKVQTYAEEFTVDMRSLQEFIRWNPEAGNKGVLAMPSTNNGCIKFKIDGRFKVLNSITISYTNEKSIYHGVKLEREKKEGMSKGEASRLLRKANYQWSTPQSGRQPSTLQFLVDIQAGDELCVQKSLKSTIYPSSTDNNFLIEKIS